MRRERRSWALYLQEYNLTVQYIKGCDNIVADTLSRYPPEVESLPPNNLEFNVNLCKISSQLSVQLKSLPAEQRRDLRLSQIISNLESNVSFNGCECYFIHNNILFFKSPKNGSVKLCIPQSLEISVIKSAHTTIGHFGGTKTYHYLKEIAIFPKLENKVRNVIKSCLDCQKCKISNKTYFPPLVPVMSNKLLSLVSVDLFGPLPKSKGNFQFVLLALDVYSKFIKAYPLRNSTAVLVTRKITQNYLVDVGTPETIISDHGPCFRSDYWGSALKDCGIQPRKTSVYHPASNPVERYMRTLGEFLRVHCHENHKSWVDYLIPFEDCVNSTYNESTGFTPIEIVKKVKPFNFLSTLVNFPPDSVIQDHNLKLLALEEHQTKKAKVRKQRFDENHSLYNFKVGDLVLLRTHHLSNALRAETKKFFALFNGPYKIVKEVGKNAFQLQETDSKRSVGVHNAVFLKPFNSPIL